MNTYHIFVGSHNPVKIKAAELAVQTLGEINIKGYDVPSGVSSQPMSDDETRRGAENRARRALALGLSEVDEAVQKNDVLLGVGMEGGVFENEKGELWSTVWGVVIESKTKQVYHANGGRILIPDIIASRIKAGEEMGPVVQQLVGVADVRTRQGMFGIITNNLVQRTEEYSNVIKMAVGLWYGRDWLKPLLKP